MKKVTFLEYEKPLLCAMILCSTPNECIAKIKASLADGAEAIGVQMCRIKKEYRTKEQLKRIFDACEGKPVYITSYRASESQDCTDEECAEYLLMGLEAGGTLCDIYGDMFEAGAKYQLATDEEAVKRQMALAEEIHKRGGEVLFSCHTQQTTTVEENLYIAKEQARRGADVIKIVSLMEDKRELPAYIESVQRITAEVPKKLLLLTGRASTLLRYIGPSIGVCMYLCVHEHGPEDTPLQPKLKTIKAVRDNIIFE